MAAVLGASAIILGVTASAATARADIIHMKDGSRVEGRVLDDAGAEIILEVNAAVTLRIPKTDVARVERMPTPREDFEARLAATEKWDVKALEALAHFCQDAGLDAEQRRVWEHILAADPDHAQARVGLDYRKDGDRWVTEEEWRSARGQVRYKGKWMLAEEAEWRAGEAKARKRVERLVKDMRNRRGKGWEAAEAELAGTADPHAEPALIEAIVHRDEEVRLAVVDAHGGGSAAPGSKRAVAALVATSLVDPEPGIRDAAAQAAAKVGREIAMPLLLEALYDDASSKRARAAHAVGRLGDIEAVPYLIDALYGVKRRRVREMQEEFVEAPTAVTGRPRRYGVVDTPSGYRVRRVVDGFKNFYIFNEPALTALRHLTEQDFHYSKEDWFRWWEEREHEREEGDGPDDSLPRDPRRDPESGSKAPGGAPGR